MIDNFLSLHVSQSDRSYQQSLFQFTRIS